MAIFGVSVAGVARGQVITEYAIPCPFPCEIVPGYPIGIASGSDGNVWFTERGTVAPAYPPKATYIARITATGVISQFSIPTYDSGLVGIAAGPNGNLWFTEASSNKIGQITTAGLVTAEFSIPTENSQPYYIATGPDGNLWFTEYGAGQIGQITTTGIVVEFGDVPTPVEFLREK